MSQLAQERDLAITATLFVGVFVAWRIGQHFMASKSKKPAPHYGGVEPQPSDWESKWGAKRLSESFEFDPQCQVLTVVMSPLWKQKYRAKYLAYRLVGQCDAETIARNVLSSECPQCAWPPTPDSSSDAHHVWEDVLELFAQVEADLASSTAHIGFPVCAK